MLRNYLRKDSIIFICILFIISCFLFYLNTLFPLYSDDYIYLFKYTDNQNFERIDSISDIFISQYNHYFSWGGRSVVHFIGQFILLFDIRIIDLLNTLAYVSLTLIIYFIANYGRGLNIYLYLLINMSIWLLVPSPIGTILWIMGSVNYTWGMLITLLFLYQYYRYLRYEKYKSTILKSIVFFLFGIIAGWTNENISISVIIILAFFLFYLRIYKKTLPDCFLYGFIGLILGCVIMVLAPGNAIRSIEVMEYLGIYGLSRFKIFRIQLHNMFSISWIYVVCIIVAYSLLLYIYLLKKSIKENYKIIFGSLAFLSAAFFSFSVLIILPYVPVRAFYGINLFILISFAIIYANIEFSSLKGKAIHIACFILFTFYFITQFTQLYSQLFNYYTTSKFREEAIYQQKSKGIMNVVLPENSNLYGDKDDLSTDSLEIYNKVYSVYYGVHSIKLVPEKEYNLEK